MKCDNPKKLNSVPTTKSSHSPKKEPLGLNYITKSTSFSLKFQTININIRSANCGQTHSTR